MNGKRPERDLQLIGGLNTRDFLQGVIEHSDTVFYICRYESNYPFVYITENVSMFGYTADEFSSGRIAWLAIVHPDDVIWLNSGFDEYLAQERIQGSLTETYRITTKSGERRWVLDQTYPVWNEEGQITHVQGLLVDITTQKEQEEELRLYKEQLQFLVKKRTEQLEKVNGDLEVQKLALEQKQIALHEVLSQIEDQNRQIKRDIALNVERLLLPVLRVLKQRIGAAEEGYVDLVEKTAREITTSFGRELADEMIGLTPRETEICNLIRNNLSTKEIAVLLGVSTNSVDWHRYNIRRKFNLLGKPVNLSVYLRNFHR